MDGVNGFFRQSAEMLEVTRAISVAILWLSLGVIISLAWNSIPMTESIP